MTLIIDPERIRQVRDDSALQAAKDAQQKAIVQGLILIRDEAIRRMKERDESHAA